MISRITALAEARAIRVTAFPQPVTAALWRRDGPEVQRDLSPPPQTAKIMENRFSSGKRRTAQMTQSRTDWLPAVPTALLSNSTKMEKSNTPFCTITAYPPGNTILLIPLNVWKPLQPTAQTIFISLDTTLWRKMCRTHSLPNWTAQPVMYYGTVPPDGSTEPPFPKTPLNILKRSMTALLY